MFCRKCGNQIIDNDKFCSKCGMVLRRPSEPPKPDELLHPVRPDPGNRGYESPWSRESVHREESNSGNREYDKPWSRGPAHPEKSGFDNRGYGTPTPRGSGYPARADPYRPIYEPAKTPIPPKNNRKSIKLIVGLIVGVAIIVGGFFAVQHFQIGFGGRERSNDILVTDSIRFFQEGDRIVVSPNNDEIFTINGELTLFQWSKDGSIAVLLTDASREDGDSGTLWLVNTTEAVRIADGVYGYLLSASGNAVLYHTDYNEREETATLNLYNVDSGRSRVVTNEVYYDGWRSDFIAISPDGRSITYIGDFNWEDNTFMGYIEIDGGEPEQLGENMFGIAVSDGGRFIYYLRYRWEDDTVFLYVRSEGEDNRLHTNANSSEFTIILNFDYSEAIINEIIWDEYDEWYRSFISLGGGERESIGNFYIEEETLDLMPRLGDSRMSSVFGVIISFGIDSFAERVVWAGEVDNHGYERSHINYIDIDFQISRIPGTDNAAQNAQLVENGDVLIFRDWERNRLNRVVVGDENAEVEVLARNVENFRVSSDGRTVYIVNDNNELFYVEDEDNTVRIADDIDSWSLEMMYGSNRVFFIGDYDSHINAGTLYYSDSGGDRVRVPGGNDVVRVWSTVSSVFYRNIDGDIYRSNGDENFQRIVRGDMD
jgi:hypothetical protein